MATPTTAPAPLFGTELVVSQVSTPGPNPHKLRRCDLYLPGDQQGAECQVCDAYGEFYALAYLPAGSFGCQTLDPFAETA
ncbi:hypothetical protein [Streptomyces venezuelae]|uniref:hypothetical protein n=1 Tax=Streptomyces venezuelae TaxID=54571 RepID=UPI00343A78AC